MESSTAAARVLLASTLVAAGEWTTYGDLGLAATGGPAARLVARLAAGHPGFVNAHRVLRSGGVIVRGPGAEDEERLARARLESEGIVFRGRFADPRQRVSWLAVRGRLYATTGRGMGRGCRLGRMQIERIRARGTAEPAGHYTDAVRAGDTVYISGLVALDAEGQVVGRGDVVEQARQVFRNLALVLSAAGASAEDVVKVTIFMRDIRRRADINPIRQAFFGTHRPASTMVEVSGLVNDDLLIEIEAVAVLPGD